MKEYLSQKGIDYKYFDISLDLGALARFLKIRDNNSIYDSVKKSGRIGLPTVIIEKEIVIGFDEEKIDALLV